LESSNEPLLDADDIQGNVIPGFRRKRQLFVGFSLGGERSDLRSALGAVADRVTSLPTVLQHRDDRKISLMAGFAPPTRSDLWLNIALGLRATDKLGLADLSSLDEGFRNGMGLRAGDPTNPTLDDGRPNPAYFKNWKVGGPNNPLDVLLIFASDGDIEQEAAGIVNRISGAGLQLIYTERGELLPNDAEHFGFQDGISQPGVTGLVDVGGVRRPVTTRYGVPDQQGFTFGKPGQPLAEPDQFLIDPTGSGGMGNLKNGTFLVFRRLQQDVGGFYSDTANMAADLSTKIGRSISPEELRARIVGRWPSGQPLMRLRNNCRTDPEDPLALNYFGFLNSQPDLTLNNGMVVPGAGGDPDPLHGVRCPVWAHIRKVNPRDLGTDKGGAAETLGFQMLRRGIPFGELFDHNDAAASGNKKDRGLLFVAYQRSPALQFETLNT
jgi:Dyp-type peroxidase family